MKWEQKMFSTFKPKKDYLFNKKNVKFFSSVFVSEV